MQFSDTTNQSGLIQACETTVFGSDYTAISSNTNLLATFTRYLNNGLNSASIKILNSDTRWQFDDSTFSDYPIGTTNLVDSQQDYVFDNSHIKITNVYVKDSNGNFYPLKPIDEYDLSSKGIAPTEFLETDGAPEYYDKKSNAIFIYPPPATAQVTITAGLKVVFQRPPNYYVSSDTTRRTGLPEIFDKLVYLYACFDHFTDNTMREKASDIKVQIQEQEELIQDFFNKRGKDEKPRLVARKHTYR